MKFPQETHKLIILVTKKGNYYLDYSNLDISEEELDLCILEQIYGDLK